MALYLKTNDNVFKNKNFGYENVDGYQEYLESDGNAYINTGWTGYRSPAQDVAGVIPSDAPRFEIKFETSENTFKAILGTLTYNQPYIATNGAKVTYSGNGANFINIPLNSGKNIIEIGSVYSKLNNNQIADNSDMTKPYRVNAYLDSPILLFGAYYNSGGGSQFEITDKTKIYYFKAYEGERLVLDLRPYKVNGVICMRDELTKTYYFNAGSGAFN